MTIEQVTDRFQRAMGRLGTDVLDNAMSQVLDISDGHQLKCFVELVLNDATLLPEARAACDEVKRSIEAANVVVDEIIMRARWTVETIGAPYFNPVIFAGEFIDVVIRSGSQRATVRVEVTHFALQMIKDRAGDTPDALAETVRAFLEQQLSYGGQSYWDPQAFSVQRLNEAAVSFVFQETFAYRQLRRTIDAFFNPQFVENSLKMISQRRLVLSRFEDVLQEMAVGGRATRGQQFVTNPLALFSTLVGMHFLPLAHIFKVPRYYALGAWFCAIPAATLLALSPAQRIGGALAWYVLPALLCGAGAVLIGGMGLHEVRNSRSRQFPIGAFSQ